MATEVKIGPESHGRRMSWQEYLAGDYEEGFRYELIDGKLYVSSQANLPEDVAHNWLRKKLSYYSDDHPKIINHVTGPARVFVWGREDITAPEPDVVAYRNFPLHLPVRQMRWEDVSPILVGEVLSAGDPNKDLVRNVELYLLVPSIREYWAVDARADADHPRMRVHRRHGERWRVLDLEPSATYTTRLLPGFELTLDVRT